jgi:hypothetical protein
MLAPSHIVIDGRTYALVAETPENASLANANAALAGAKPNPLGKGRGGGKKEKKEKKVKGTRKLSPYMKFAQEARKNIIAEHPDWKSDIIKVGKEIGAKWRALSDSEKSKY